MTEPTMEEKILQLMQQDVDQAEMFVKYGEELVKLTGIINSQGEMLKGLMFVLDAAMSLSRMHNQRLAALEQRAEGLSFEDMVNGTELKPLGPTPEHFEMLTQINAGLEALVKGLSGE